MCTGWKSAGAGAPPDHARRRGRSGEACDGRAHGGALGGRPRRERRDDGHARRELDPRQAPAVRDHPGDEERQDRRRPGRARLPPRRWTRRARTAQNATAEEHRVGVRGRVEEGRLARRRGHRRANVDGERGLEAGGRHDDLAERGRVPRAPEAPPETGRPASGRYATRWICQSELATSASPRAMP